MIRTVIALLFGFQVIVGCAQQATPQNNQSSGEPTNESDLRAMILEETQEGGKYDFFTSIKGQEYDGIQIKPGIYTTKSGVALYKWGKANYMAGVESVEDVFSIFSEYKGRPVNEKEKTYLKLGFNRELEK